MTNKDPLGIIAGSHKGPLFDQYNEDNQWIGCLSDEDAMQLDRSRETYLPGPAGSITIHNCRTVHGSRKSTAQIDQDPCC